MSTSKDILELLHHAKDQELLNELQKRLSLPASDNLLEQFTSLIREWEELFSIHEKRNPNKIATHEANKRRLSIMKRMQARMMAIEMQQGIQQNYKLDYEVLKMRYKALEESTQEVMVLLKLKSESPSTTSIKGEILDVYLNEMNPEQQRELIETLNRSIS